MSILDITQLKIWYVRIKFDFFFNSPPSYFQFLKTSFNMLHSKYYMLYIHVRRYINAHVCVLDGHWFLRFLVLEESVFLPFDMSRLFRMLNERWTRFFILDWGHLPVTAKSTQMLLKHPHNYIEVVKRLLSFINSGSL